MAGGVFQFLYLAAGILYFLAFSMNRRPVRFAAFAAAAATLLAHAAYLTARSFESGHPPLTNMYETLHLLAFLSFLVFSAMRFRWPLDLAGGFAGLISGLLVASSALASPEIQPLLPALKSNWLLFHVTACFLAYSSFAVAMGSSISYLSVNPKNQALLSRLDTVTHRMVLFGYPFLTLGIATGAVWAELTWGRYWNWDPKEAWAFSTWLVYAVYLHLKYLKPPRPRFMAWVAVAAFGLVLFTYYGVNIWLATLHDYA